MKRFKKAFRGSNLVLFIIAIALIVFSIIMFLVWTTNFEDMYIIVTVIALIFVVSFMFGSISSTKNTIHSICEECLEFMGKTDQLIEYEFVCTSYEDKYDSNGKYINTKFYYTISCVCPHCNTTNIWTETVLTKNISRANEFMNKRIRSLLKITK